jgi:hypothetical protein
VAVGMQLLETRDRLKRIKDAKNEDELRRLTEELQKIVFHKQYQHAED